MDELVVSGAIALLVFYAGIVLVVYGILRLLLLIAQVAFSGDYLVLSGLVADITVVIIAYVIIGLWLRRTGTI